MRDAMKPTARTTLTHSLLVTLALAVTAALAACGGESAAGHDSAAGANSVTGTGSAGATGSSAAAGATASAGTTPSVGATAGAGPTAGGGTAANVPAAAIEIACPAPLALPQYALGPSSQIIPAGFRPVAVVQCVVTSAVALHSEGAHVLKEAALADLGPLVAALREPSAGRAGVSPPAGCPVLAVAPPGLALVGRDGAVIYPRIPVTVCGAPIQAVAASLAALHWIVLGTTRVPQGVQPQGVQPQGLHVQGVQPQRALPSPIVVRPGS
jgi:hypothetical protein